MSPAFPNTTTGTNVGPCIVWAKTGSCPRGYGCPLEHHPNLAANQLRVAAPDYLVPNEPGVACLSCSKKLVECDKQGRDNENNPCSECRWFGGADGKCVAALHATYNDQAWAQMLNRNTGLDTAVKYTLPPQKSRVEGKVRWRNWKPKVLGAGPMLHVKAGWQGESRDSPLSKPDFIPAAVRANIRAYLVPPTSELEDLRADQKRAWKDAHSEEHPDMKRARQSKYPPPITPMRNLPPATPHHPPTALTRAPDLPMFPTEAPSQPRASADFGEVINMSFSFQT